MRVSRKRVKRCGFKSLYWQKFDGNAFSIWIVSVLECLEHLLDLSIAPETLVRSDLLRPTVYFGFIINIIEKIVCNSRQSQRATVQYRRRYFRNVFTSVAFIVWLLFKSRVYAIQQREENIKNLATKLHIYFVYTIVNTRIQRRCTTENRYNEKRIWIILFLFVLFARVYTGHLV